MMGNAKLFSEQRGGDVFFVIFQIHRDRKIMKNKTTTEHHNFLETWHFNFGTIQS